MVVTCSWHGILVGEAKNAEVEFSVKMWKLVRPAPSTLDPQLTATSTVPYSSFRNRSKMKILFAVVLLAAAVLSSEAAPSQTVQLNKNDNIKMLVLTEAGNGNLHDIWSICSKYLHSVIIIWSHCISNKPQKDVRSICRMN